MTVLQALILGVVQGATEFLPISSSAHLVLLPALLGWRLEPDLAFVFDVLVQVGTILAVVGYFWRDWWDIGRAVLVGLYRREPFGTAHARLGWLIALATVPAVLLGILFKDFFESVFQNPAGVAALLLVTALLLSGSERLSAAPRATLHARQEDVGWRDALVMGLFQALAILPGISRSGSTIAGGLLRGLDRSSAARFSFLMAVPVMLGAGAVAVKDLLALDGWTHNLSVVAVGFVAAAVVGLLSIHWLLRFLVRHTLYAFAIYCALVGLTALLAACTPATAAQATATREMRVGATPATLPLAQAWAERYQGDIGMRVEAYPSRRRLLQALQKNEVAAAVSLHVPEEGSLFAVPLAVTALAVVVHRSNSVTSITRDQLGSLFAGRITDWSAVDGQPSTVQVLVLDESSDVRQAFDALVMNGSSTGSELALRLTPDAILAPDAAAVLEYVAETPGAIGYAPAALIDAAPVKQLEVEGSVADGEDYALVATVLGLTPEEPHGAVRAFLAWAQTEGQAELPQGYGPLP